ncbi:MAG: YciI family protein [Actinomycetota bacterium]
MKAGDALVDVDQATSVRVRDGERLVTDGPFAETKEALGGYYLLEVDNLDDAIEAAAACPGARNGTIELRPVAELPEMPQG